MNKPNYEELKKKAAFDKKQKELQRDIDFQQKHVDRMRERLKIEENNLKYMKEIKRNQMNIENMPKGITKEE